MIRKVTSLSVLLNVAESLLGFLCRSGTVLHVHESSGQEEKREPRRKTPETDAQALINVSNSRSGSEHQSMLLLHRCPGKRIDKRMGKVVPSANAEKR